MKKTETFIVLRNKKTGGYVQKCKSNEGAFTFSEKLTGDIQDAATNAVESVEMESHDLKALAKGLGCEILVVEANYTLKTLDGEEPKDLTEEIEKAKRKHFENLFSALLGNNSKED